MDGHHKQWPKAWKVEKINTRPKYESLWGLSRRLSSDVKSSIRSYKVSINISIMFFWQSIFAKEKNLRTVGSLLLDCWTEAETYWYCSVSEWKIYRWWLTLMTWIVDIYETCVGDFEPELRTQLKWRSPHPCDPKIPMSSVKDQAKIFAYENY